MVTPHTFFLKGGAILWLTSRSPLDVSFRTEKFFFTQNLCQVYMMRCTCEILEEACVICPPLVRTHPDSDHVECN